MLRNAWVKWLGGILVVAATAFLTYWFFAPDADKADLLGNDKLAGRTNILVLGVDERDGDAGRSDTMFVAMYDPKNQQVSLMSVPRDTRVKIPGHGWEKINHSFAYGGYKLTQRTVEELLGIRINHYIVIDFKGFQKVVDAMGGIDINVEKRMFYEDPYDNLVIDLSPGMQHMDGRTAIQYVRYRDEEGDIGRIKRQQHFIQAVQEKLMSSSIVVRLSDMVKAVTALIKTDMSTTEMLNLGRSLQQASKQGLKMDTIPGTPAYIDEVSYWLPDISVLRKRVAEMQGGETNDRFTNTSERLAEEYKAAIPAAMEVVKTPEAIKPTTKAATVVKDADKTSSDAAGKAKSQQVRVRILNGSGSPAAVAKMRELLAGRGITVVSSSDTDSAKTSLAIAHTQTGQVVGKLSNLPFAYQTQLRSNTDSYDGTVIIGQDFVKK